MNTHDLLQKQNAESSEKLDLNEFLPYRLSNLADRISVELSSFYEEYYSLTVAQWRVLAWLSHSDLLNAKQIRSATRMDKARVSRAVQALVDRGLISRKPASHDQRHHDLQLTEEGRVLLAKLIPEAKAWEAELIAPLSSGEKKELLRIMAKLEFQLEKLGSTQRD